jgi:haloalkane dehalogenase
MWASGSTGWGSMIPASIGGYQWRGALDELAALRTCIAPDLMGLGFTEARAGQDLSFEAQALAAFLDRRAIGRSIWWARTPGEVSARTLPRATRTRCVPPH